MRILVILNVMLLLAACKKDTGAANAGLSNRSFSIANKYKYRGNYSGASYTNKVQPGPGNSILNSVDTGVVAINVMAAKNTGHPLIYVKVGEMGYLYPFNANLIAENKTVESNYYTSGPPTTIRFSNDSLYLFIRYNNVVSARYNCKKIN